VKKHVFRCAVSIVLASALSPTGLALAQDEEDKELGWFDTAELTFVQTAGNAEASSLGLRNSLERVWEEARFTFDARAFRAETTTIERTAVGDPLDFRVVENKTSEVTAENYLLRGRYDHDFSARTFWYVRAGWERNEFAGFTDRLQMSSGVGTTWHDDKVWHLRTNYGVTYTDQTDVVEDPAADNGFFGLQLGYDYFRQLTGNTTFDSVLILDANLEESEDWRSDWTNSLAVAMNARLALKLSLQLLYDHMPALTEVSLIDAAGAPTGETVLTELDELDSQLTIALVVNF
jgi:putative salt-induced outer membrane protein YdiY